jgi:hypothetical protein
MPLEGFPSKKRTHKRRKGKEMSQWFGGKEEREDQGRRQKVCNSRKKRWESDRPIAW